MMVQLVVNAVFEQLFLSAVQQRLYGVPSPHRALLFQKFSYAISHAGQGKEIKPITGHPSCCNVKPYGPIPLIILDERHTHKSADIQDDRDN